MVKDRGVHEKKNDFDINYYWKILRYIHRSKNQRLYVQLAKAVILRLNNHNWKEENLKNLIFMFNTIVSLEKMLYSRFDIVNEFIKEITNRKGELSQADIIKVLEGASVLR